MEFGGFLFLFSTALAIAIGIFLHPSWSPIEPVAFYAPHAPSLEGPLTPLPRLLEGQKLFAGEVIGPEDLIIDAEGNLYSSNADGTILKLWKNGTVSVWARVGGHPLGIKWLEEGTSMLVCEPFQGLLLVSSDGQVELLSSESEGLKFRLVDNVVVASDGSIYFTDASSKFGLNNYIHDVLEAKPHGRLLKYAPHTRTTETLLSGLYFANGVALSKDESFLVITETARYRIRRFYLSGPEAGSDDVIVDSLPGFPDNVNLGDDGLFWVALVLPRQPLVEILHKIPAAKALLARLPTSTWGHFMEMGFVMAFSEAGDVAHVFNDIDGEFYRRVTTVKRFGDKLVFGSLLEDSVLMLDLGGQSGSATE